ncbi:hypothetical protein ERO13_A03G136500v2 [Gossypium hirsutum]|uniref:Poor homologous synapsis 1 PH domain-containing protein n=2 Tax=Gossypium TaxID=3633 RepID=A0A5J5WDJ6_GOSBA|nr:hypothetical protein ES319_A03G149000v1 [Gossypium barbadense]KAG4208500.1 hypothetical protein ERO13_A03G136500v2 [Gossypium hirsutum]TYH25431.1 hypothetical protein ES288_A03G168400v1 [Gossypium darwinii]
MAGTDRPENEKPVYAIKGQWQAHFARFIVYPSLPSTCPSLVPKSRRGRASSGNWIATSSPAASVQIIIDLSSSETVLSICLGGKILEEHYISKLHFSWPQIQCIPEIPARGSRAVFVSYKDCADQKFALQFSTHHESESFMNAVKEEFQGDAETEPLNPDFGSDSSPQSDFISSNGLPSRANQESSDLNPDGSYTPQMSPGLSYEIRQQSFDQDEILTNNAEGILPPLPPSFSSLLTNCCPTAEKAANQPTVSQEIDLKSQIVRYMEDSSFQDMLTKVEKIISEVGADVLL